MKTRIGIVGAGWMGTALMQRVVNHPTAEVVALHQRRREPAEKVLSEMGLDPGLYRPTYQALVDDPNVDAVFLCGPNSTHAPQAISALEAGKHVFSEKPASTTLAEHRRLVELANAHPELVTLVDYILYFDTFEQRLREMIEQDAFGKLTQVQVNYRHPINIAGDKAWKLDRTIMGDAIGMGINHALSVMLIAMRPQAKPVEVYATNMPAQVRGFEAEPIWNLMVRFDNGASGIVVGNVDSANGYDAFHSFSGTKGALVFDSLTEHNAKVKFWSESQTDGKWCFPLDAERCKREGQTAWPADTTTPDNGDVIQHQTREVVEHFIQCIQDGKPSPLGLDHAAIIADVGWAAQVSAKLNRPVALPLDMEEAQRVLG